MGMTAGALNTAGFSQSISKGVLPQSTSLSYEGCFNEIAFPLNGKTQDSLEIEDYAFTAKDPMTGDTDVFLACFVKAFEDGRPRAPKRNLHLSCLLDISGSMSGKRIVLAKQAITMMGDKLEPGDSLSLITFNYEGKVIVPTTPAQLLGDKIQKALVGVSASGGTSIYNGLVLAYDTLLRQAVTAGDRRVLMLTDVEDNSLMTQQKIIEQFGVKGIGLTIVGIGQGFRSDICQQLINFRGFNYFCAADPQSLKEYLVDKFDFTLFPCKYDLKIRLKGNFGVEAVFGACKQQEGLPGVDVASIFPSQVVEKEGFAWYQGSLHLYKLREIDPDNNLLGKWEVSFSEQDGKQARSEFKFQHQLGDIEAFIQPSLKQAATSFYYVRYCKQVIQRMWKGRQDKTISDDQFQKYDLTLRNLLESLTNRSQLESVEHLRKQLAQQVGK